MERRRIGSSEVTATGQGTWQMEHDRPQAVRALRRGLDLGLTHIDTAEMYGAGAVEALVGKVLLLANHTPCIFMSPVKK